MAFYHTVAKKGKTLKELRQFFNSLGIGKKVETAKTVAADSSRVTKPVITVAEESLPEIGDTVRITRSAQQVIQTNASRVMADRKVISEVLSNPETTALDLLKIRGMIQRSGTAQQKQLYEFNIRKNS